MSEQLSFGAFEGPVRARAADLLARARERIRRGWVLVHPAVTADGEIVHTDHVLAVAWSVTGAVGLGRLRDAPGGDVEAEEEALRLLGEVLRGDRWKSEAPDVRRWSEDPRRTREEVLAVLEMAETLARRTR